MASTHLGLIARAALNPPRPVTVSASEPCRIPAGSVEAFVVAAFCRAVSL